MAALCLNMWLFSLPFLSSSSFVFFSDNDLKVVDQIFAIYFFYLPPFIFILLYTFLLWILTSLVMDLQFHSPLFWSSSLHSPQTFFLPSGSNPFQDSRPTSISRRETMHIPTLLLVSILFASFAVSLSDKFLFADSEQFKTLRFGSSVLFPVRGNVYPLGFVFCVLWCFRFDFLVLFGLIDCWNLQAFYGVTQYWQSA